MWKGGEVLSILSSLYQVNNDKEDLREARWRPICRWEGPLVVHRVAWSGSLCPWMSIPLRWAPKFELVECFAFRYLGKNHCVSCQKFIFYLPSPFSYTYIHFTLQLFTYCTGVVQNLCSHILQKSKATATSMPPSSDMESNTLCIVTMCLIWGL